MKLKVAHLLRKLQHVDRDISEIGSLQQNLKPDREYTARLRDSLVEESSRLKRLKERMLEQTIMKPDESLSAQLQDLFGSRQNQTTAPLQVADEKQPEIEIPGRQEPGSRARSEEITAPTTPKTAARPVTKDEEPENKKTRYKFKYK